MLVARPKPAPPETHQLIGGPFDGREVAIDPKDPTVLVGEVGGRLQVLLGPDLDRAQRREVYHRFEAMQGGAQWRHVQLQRPEWAQWSGSDEVSP